VLNILLSFPYVDDGVIRAMGSAPDNVRILLDSGAFTAWKAGTEIDFDAYIAFLKDPPFPIWRYMTLDVVGDPTRTEANTKRLRDAGLNPIPIFTRGDSIDRIDEMYLDSDLVALGGLVGTRGNTGFVRGVMRHIGDRRVHWLGFTRHQFLCYYRPYSVDAANWQSAARYGSSYLYHGRGKMTQINRSDFHEKPSAETMTAIRRLGFDPKLFQHEQNWRGSRTNFAVRLCASSYIRYMQDLERQTGTRFFMSCGCEAGEIYLTLVFEEAQRLRCG